jgi:anti-sigma factor ChrR (cupin superfamily)
MRRRYIVLGFLVMILFAALQLHAQPWPAHTVSMPETLKWAEPPVLPGARLAVVEGDPSTAGPFVYRIKMPPAYKIPPHTHKASENVTDDRRGGLEVIG